MSTEVSAPAQTLSRGQLIALSISSFMPASGLATVPLVMVASAGYGSWLAAGIAAVVTILLGATIIVFARRFVASGSLYSYVGMSAPEWTRYVTGASLLLGYVAQLAAASLLLSIFFGSVLSSHGHSWAGQPGGQIAIILVVLVVTLAVVLRGLDVSVLVAVLLAAVSVPFVVVIVLASGLHTGLDLSAQLSLEGASLPGVFAGVAAGAGFLFGFESCAALAEETKDAQRSVPWAVMSAPVLLGAAYLVSTLFSTPGLMQVGDQLSAGVSAPSALAGLAGLPGWFGSATDLVLTVSIFAGLIGFTNYGARFLTTLADDGLLPPALAVNNRRGAPARAAIILAVMSMVLLLIVLLVVRMSIVDVITAAGIAIVFCWIPPYLLISVAALRLLAQRQEARPLIVTTILAGAALVAWVLVSNILAPAPSPLNSIPYVTLGGIGVTVAAFVLIKRRSGIQRS